MFSPKYPTPDIAPTPATSLVRPPAVLAHLPACDCHQTPAPTPAPVPRSTVQITPGALIAVVVGGTVVVLVVGAVLVSMLLAVAITGASVAICAVVLRSLVNHADKGR
ncbi:SpdD protein [Streptomyces sp. NBC_01005]|uniref:SpdD protein n=1 Tax=unclassified Streptomyces TaxID=2593676 RepID=UPI00386F0B8C|nr:SpdD protein [Streptomyces sp. NBC_01005]WTC96104.1 SpdD protein [Streptomyces sp. NBC_01650]